MKKERHDDETQFTTKNWVGKNYSLDPSYFDFL